MEVMEYADRTVSVGYEMPQGMPITTSEHPKKVYGGMWKLIPHWLTTWEEAKAYANTLNARCEDIFTKNSYRQYIGTNRALLWINGFFEPQHPKKEKNGKKGVTVPQYVKPKDGKIMSLGCVYNNWRNPDTGRLITTFAIITTEPNELLSEVNNDGLRMPYIVPEQDRERWLSKLTKEEIIAMMQPLPDGLLEAYPVRRDLYKPGADIDTPDSLFPVNPDSDLF